MKKKIIGQSFRQNSRNSRNQKSIPAKARVCFFCSEKIGEIDYKDTELLRRFMTSQAKIASPKRTGICARHQRMLANAIKKARYMAIVPYTLK